MGFLICQAPAPASGQGDQTGVHFLTVKITVGFHVKAVSQFIGQCANRIEIFQHRMHHRFFIVEVERLHLTKVAGRNRFRAAPCQSDDESYGSVGQKIFDVFMLLFLLIFSHLIGLRCHQAVQFQRSIKLILERDNRIAVEQQPLALVAVRHI